MGKTPRANLTWPEDEPFVAHGGRLYSFGCAPVEGGFKGLLEPQSAPPKECAGVAEEKAEEVVEAQFVLVMPAGWQDAFRDRLLDFRA